MKFFPLFLSIPVLFSPFSSLFGGEISEDIRFDRYLNLFNACPEAMGKMGDWKTGEIEILTDADEISKAEQSIYKSHIANGFPPESAHQFSKVGVVAEDAYFIFVRDAVMFPSGKHGTYDRVLPKHSLNGPGGVVILPVLPDKQIVTILTFRHATRSWCIELPRGSREVDESPESAVKRELNEETGYLADSVELIGHIVPASGILSTKSPIYCVQSKMQIEPNHDYSEAISGVVTFTKEQIKEGLAKGYVEMNIMGKHRNVLVMDSNISHALLLAESKDLL